jgi:hypothetical protein
MSGIGGMSKGERNSVKIRVRSAIFPPFPDTGGVGSPVTRQRRIEVGELLRWPGVPPMAQFKDRDGNTFEIVEASG